METVSNLSKIIVATNAITWMATRAAEVNAEIRMLNNALKDSKDFTEDHKKIHTDRYKTTEEILLKAATGLRQVAEDLGNYIDGCDMLDDNDVVVTTPLFDIMYDRKPEKS